MAAHDPAAAIEQPHSPFATARIPASTASSCAPRLLEAALIYMSVFIMDKMGTILYTLSGITSRSIPSSGIIRSPISPYSVIGRKTTEKPLVLSITFLLV